MVVEPVATAPVAAEPEPAADPPPAAGQESSGTPDPVPAITQEPLAGPEPEPAAMPVPAPRPAASRRPAGARRTEARRPARRASTEDAAPFCVVTGPDGGCLIRSNRCDFLGTDGDDTLDGTPGPDVICGLGGDDVLSGGDGDTLVGGPGNDRFTKVTPDDCVVSGDGIDRDELEACQEVDTFRQAVEATRQRPPRVVQGAPGGGGGTSGVVSQTAGAGQVYVALNRYLSANEAPDRGSAAIAVILKSFVRYEDGKIHFLLRCSYAGDGRVVLTAVGRKHRRVRLGAVRFHCSGERDDPDPSVEVSASGRRLLERSARVHIGAQVLDTDLERQPAGARQAFVLTP